MTGVWSRAVATGVVLLGVVTSYVAFTSYKVGDLSNMGPGYFPVLIGVLLAIVGCFNLALDWKSDAEPPRFLWGSFLLVLAGIVAWGLLVERLGLMAASAVLIVLSAIARPPINVVQLTATAVICSLLTGFIFIYGFGLPLKMFVWP